MSPIINVPHGLT